MIYPALSSTLGCSRILRSGTVQGVRQSVSHPPGVSNGKPRSGTGSYLLHSLGITYSVFMRPRQEGGNGFRLIHLQCRGNPRHKTNFHVHLAAFAGMIFTHCTQASLFMVVAFGILPHVQVLARIFRQQTGIRTWFPFLRWSSAPVQ